MNPTTKKENVPVDEPLSPVEPKAPPPRTAGRRRAFLIFFLVLALVGAGVFFYWLHASQFESTDDAYVQMHLDPVSSRVDGTIAKVYVEDNQFVHAGDPLVDLDPRDFQVVLDQANAALNQARSQVSAQQPNVPIT